ncbi:MAG TPA: lytic transglycosylase domain-containing protein [Bacteroidia bacterium]|nr:lytic transglycosylase domain-containing protein [Bacteroidia bacterium]
MKLPQQTRSAGFVILRKKNIFLLIFILVPLALLLVYFSPLSDVETQKQFLSEYKIYPPALPDSLDFAGERVPLEQFDVRERIERELLVNTYWQSQTILLVKRSARWFPVIDSILKQNNVPEDFKFLSAAESGFINVVSPAGAVGYWQFLKATGKKYDLEINDEVDERYNIELSTQAACEYFNEAYKQFKSWSLVAASYNMGMDGVQKQIDKQKVSSYYDLLLNDETFRYLARIVAMKEIIMHPDRYGFHLRRKDLYAPYKYYEVCADSSITDLAEFSFSMGINYKKLKLLNPWLRQNTLTNKAGKEYILKILDPAYTGIMDNAEGESPFADSLK